MDVVMWLEAATVTMALASAGAALAASRFGSRDSRRSRRAVMRLVAGYVR